jgi:hypothetical protein
MIDCYVWDRKLRSVRTRMSVGGGGGGGGSKYYFLSFY